MEYIIRQVSKKDIAQLIELCERHAQFENAEFTFEHKTLQLESALFEEHPKLHCYVVESEFRLVGYCSYTFDFSTWHAATYLHLDCLYLEPEFRGLGIGEEIMRRLQAVAKDKSCVNLQWQTPVTNSRAIKFYRRVGAVGKPKLRLFLAPEVRLSQKLFSPS